MTKAPASNTPQVYWTPAPAKTVVENGKVHLWRVSCKSVQEYCGSLEPLLSSDEVTRANHFRFSKDRERFIVARGMLRIILSRYLECTPCEVDFCYGHHGKPALAQESKDSLHFNLSHSEEIILYGIATDREIGVDIECIREDIPVMQIAAHFFSSREYAELCALPAQARAAAFFACWTGKEAYTKAVGQGLSLQLDDFGVPVAPNEQPVVRRVTQGASDWSLHQFMPVPGYVAAVAAEGQYTLCLPPLVVPPAMLVPGPDSANDETQCDIRRASRRFIPGVPCFCTTL